MLRNFPASGNFFHNKNISLQKNIEKKKSKYIEKKEKQNRKRKTKSRLRGSIHTFYLFIQYVSVAVNGLLKTRKQTFSLCCL